MSNGSFFGRPGALSNMVTVHPKPAMKELFLFSLLFSLASAMITIFEPIFFYQQSFSLSAIALYYAFHYITYAILLPLGGRFASRYGLEKSLVMCLPVLVFYLGLLAMIPSARQLFWIAPIFLTIHKIFYWPAFHAALARSGDRHNRGTELSWLGFIRYGFGILGPLIGGFIVVWFDFSTLFIVAAVTILCSAWPLLKTRAMKIGTPFSYRSPWQIIFAHRYRGMVLAMTGMGENLIDLVFWPIFMFIVLGSTAKVGVVSAFTVGVMVCVSFAVGELSDKYSRRTILKASVPFMMLGYLFRPLALSPLRVLASETFNKVAYIGVNLPMVYRLYEQATKAGDLRYTTAFELTLAITKAVTALGLAVLFAYVLPHIGFTAAFVWSSLVTAMYLFL